LETNLNKIGLNAPENQPHSFALCRREFWVEFVGTGPEGTIAVSMATIHLMTPTWGVFVHPPRWPTCTQNFKGG